MKRIMITALAVLAGWWGGADFAAAQGLMPGFGGSPFYPLGGGAMRTHPYGPIQMQPLNPQLTEIQQNLSRINTDGSLRSPLDPNGVNALGGLQTGHATTFFNTGHYFPTTPTGGSGGGQSLNTGIGGYNPTFTGGVGGFGLGGGALLGGGVLLGTGNFGGGSNLGTGRFGIR